MDTMKTGFIVIGALLVAVLGYYLLMPQTVPAVQTSDAPQAKIDINAVCEGALAYMSFPDGAAAAAWVDECKRGEYPEAIEQWKQQQGIIDDRAL